MSEPTSPNHDSQISPSSGKRRPTPPPIVLWRLRGATDDLRGLVVETTFGFALGLELDHELILLHLQPSLESLVAHADRIESALVSQGWQAVHESGGRSQAR